MNRSSSLVALGLPFGLALLCLTGCPQSAAPSSNSTSSSTTSAATDGSTGSDGSSGSSTGSSSTSGSTGADVGSSSGSTGSPSSASSASASSSSGGTSGHALQWYAQTLPAGTDTVTGIWGTSTASVYAVTGGGHVLYSTGSTWTSIYVTPSQRGLNAIYVSPSGNVWAAGESGLFECTSQCDQGNFTQVTLPSGTCFGPTGMCGVGEQAWAACDDGNGNGYLLQRQANGSGWTPIALGEAFSVSNCFAVQNGANTEVLVAAQSKVFRSGQLGVAADTIHFGTGAVAAYYYFSAVWAVGSTQFAAAPGGRLFSWSGSAWELTPLNTTKLTDQDDTGFQAIVGTDASEIFALGSESSSATVKDAYFDGNSWRATSAPVAGQSYWSGWSPSTSDYYLGGGLTNTNDGFIVRGHR